MVAPGLGEGPHPMIDFDTAAYLVLGLSLSVSVLQIGRWLLHASPRTIVAAGRWSVVGLAALVPLVLLWLTLSGRSTLAMMFAAFILPVAVQGAHRWRGLLRQLAPIRVGFAGFSADPVRRRNPDPEQVRQSVAVLRAYLEQAGQGCRMSAAEALDLLGLEPTAGATEIREAHRRLADLVAPEHGGTRRLAEKIDEARDVLLGERRIVTAIFNRGGPGHV